MDEQAVAWLRRQIEGDLAAARIVGAGGFEPQRWDTDPPGQVNPVAVPFWCALNAVLVPDDEDRADRGWMPRWVQVVAWDRGLGEPPSADCRDSDLPVMLVSDGRREVDHITRHDPRNVVADCEAKLAIVGLCARVIREDEGHGYWSDGWAGLGVARVVLGGIAAAYRHRPGYGEHWPAAAGSAAGPVSPSGP